MRRWFWAWYFVLVFGGGLLVGTFLEGSRQDAARLKRLEEPAPTVAQLQAYRAEHGEHWQGGAL